MRRVSIASFVFVLAQACVDAPGHATSFASSGESDGATTGEATSASTGTTPSTDTAQDATGPNLDVAAADDGGSPRGCEKVDFLFVVDNSGSMFDEQQKLAASFPGFISTIESTLAAQDYHVMVVDTDGFTAAGATTCSPEPCCDRQCADNPLATCNEVPCPPVGFDEVCAARMGAGRIGDAAGNPCGIAGQQRYLGDGQADIAATFACLADVGVGGNSVEKPMDALRWATSAELAEAGACNEGFLRDDAILVVTFITDEEDRLLMSEGDPPAWKDALLAAKGGNEDAIVVLGIVGDQLDGICDDGNFAQDAPRLRHFLALFDERGFTASICEPDFLPFFLAAVSTIDTTCDEFEPEG
jgi:hypothetical protein